MPNYHIIGQKVPIPYQLMLTGTVLKKNQRSQKQTRCFVWAEIITRFAGKITRAATLNPEIFAKITAVASSGKWQSPNMAGKKKAACI